MIFMRVCFFKSIIASPPIIRYLMDKSSKLFTSSIPICTLMDIPVILFSWIYLFMPSKSCRRASERMCTSAPTVKGVIKSSREASKQKLACSAQRSVGVRFKIFLRHSMSALRFQCSTITPLGFPVEPEVYIMYASDSGLLLSTGGQSLLKSICSRKSVVISTLASASSIMYCRRSLGYSLSNGRYAPPALKMPMTASMNSFRLGSMTATMLSCPTPDSIRAVARISDLLSRAA